MVFQSINLEIAIGYIYDKVEFVPATVEVE
jgi:hypothetical protein